MRFKFRPTYEDGQWWQIETYTYDGRGFMARRVRMTQAQAMAWYDEQAKPLPAPGPTTTVEEGSWCDGERI